MLNPMPTEQWLAAFNRAMQTIDGNCGGTIFGLELGVYEIRKLAHKYVEARKGRFILFGNGGSLAIAAHIATDFGLVGWPALALTDAVAITSHTNDFGPAANFSKQLELLRICADDVIIAMSCSGKSANVLEAVRLANACGCPTITLSGFETDNPLRGLGYLNFYIESHQYGIVQLAHEAVLHMACDIEAAESAL